MDYFSSNFLLLFLFAVLIVTLRSRSKKKGSQVLPGKQIAIIGRQLETPLGIETPYACLLDDGRKFGDGFLDKEEPDLPHCESCQCHFSDSVQRSYDIFTKDPPPETLHLSDMGDLKRGEARYYKYMLIAAHRDVTEADRKVYTDLAEKVEVDPSFREKVKKQLKGP